MNVLLYPRQYEKRFSPEPIACLQGKHSEAEKLYERGQAILEKVLGPEHPDLATTLNNRAQLFKTQVGVDG